MTLLIVILGWIVLSLFGWSLLRVAARADLRSRAQPMRPWVPSEEVVRDRAADSVIADRRSHTRAGTAAAAPRPPGQRATQPSSATTARAASAADRQRTPVSC